MRIDRIKLIAEMARQDININDLSEKACISRCTLSALRGGKSCTENTVKRVAAALGVTVESLMEQ
jgi:DNA-binding Xre family transcriptional regulator